MKSSILKTVFPINGREDRPVVALIEITSLGLLGDVKRMLMNGYDANEADEYGTTAALVAAEQNDLSMLKLLVEHDASLSVKDGRGRTIIGWAEKHKNQAMIDFINSQQQNSYHFFHFVC